MVLEVADGAAFAALLRLVIRPFDHFVICDLALAEPCRQGGESLADVAAHELPNEAQGQGALAIGDIGALDADEGEAHLFAKLDGVICIFDGLEAGDFGTGGRGFVHVAPVDGAGDDFIVGLEKDGAVREVVEERVDSRLDVEGIEPKGEDAGFAFAFGVKVFDLGFLLVGDGVEAWVGVEEVGDKGEVEFGVAGNEGGRGEKLATGELVGVLKDFFGALVEIAGLERGAGAEVRGELGEEDGVVVAFFDVGGEICDSDRR